MDAKTLMENLIAAIEAIPDAWQQPSDVLATIEDAKETAGLAKLVLPSLSQPATPVASGAIVVDFDHDEAYGPFPDRAAAEVWADQTLIQPHGIDVNAYDLNNPSAPPRTGTHSGTHCICGQPLDANGDCSDPNCTVTSAKSTTQGTPGIGSVIASKPPGSLYKN